MTSTSCYKVAATGLCKCDSIKPFDVKSQVKKIFEKSELSKLQNISALADFKFWESVSFWVLFGHTGFCLLSFWLVKYKIPSSMLIRQRDLGKPSLSHVARFKLLILVITVFPSYSQHK